MGRVEVDDAGIEGDVVRRGGGMNGLKVELWREPGAELERGGEWREGEEPDMPDVEADVVWSEIGGAEWESQNRAGNEKEKEGAWVVRQGTGADCSVAAGLGVSLEHNRLWGTKVSRHFSFRSPHPSSDFSSRVEYAQ